MLSPIEFVGATVVDPAGPSGFETAAPWTAPSYPSAPVARRSSRRGVVLILGSAVVLGLVVVAALLRSRPDPMNQAYAPLGVAEALPVVPAPAPPTPIVNQLLAPAPQLTVAPRPAPVPLAAALPRPPRLELPSERRHPPSRVVILAGPPLDSPAIMQGVRPRIPAIRACLDGVRANVSFSLDIDARGHVRSVNLMSPPPSSPAGRCVSRVLARLSYPSGHPTANARMFFTP